MLPNETATTRALHPVLDVGREPVLIEKATGKAMVVWEKATTKLIVSPEFYQHPHPQIFLAASMCMDPLFVVEEWQFVVAEAERIGFTVLDRIDSG